MDYCNVNPEDLIVLYDDLDLEQGQSSLKTKRKCRRSQWYEINY